MDSKSYYDNDAVRQVIGSIFKEPSLLDQNGQYFLTAQDFINDVHRIIYGAASNLYANGAEAITPIDVENYIRGRENSYVIYKSSNGAEYLRSAIEYADPDSFKYYYDKIKKMTLLRNYCNTGVDVSWIYDPNNLVDKDKKEKQLNELDNISLSELADKVEGRIAVVRLETIDKNETDAIKLGDFGYTVYEQLKQKPEVGMPFSFGVMDGEMPYSHIMNRVTYGARRGKFFLRSAPTGLGKALPNNMVIPTPNGEKKVEEVKVGDYLFDRTGHPTKVLGVFPQGEQQNYKVCFGDGREIICSKDHLWTYIRDGHRKKDTIETASTEDILKKSKGEFKKKGYKYFIPVNQAVEYPKKEFSVPPYTMGALLGDGSFRYSNDRKVLYFSSSDIEIVQRISEELGYDYHKNSQHNYNWIFRYKKGQSYHKNVWVEEILKEYPELWNIKSEDKFIPEEYFYGSVEQRKEMLQGLLDTDGSIDSSQKGRVSFFTTSKKLRDGIIRLCRSLGYICTYGIDKRKDKYQSTNGISFYVKIQASKEEKKTFFYLSRKKKIAYEYANNSKKSLTREFLPITNIIPLNTYQPMTCFLVDNPEHLFLAQDFIVTHNTRSMLADALMLACRKIYIQGEWVPLVEEGTKREGVLFISTEQSVEEIMTMSWAFLTGINEEKLITMNITPEENALVLEAIKEIDESPIYFFALPDYTITDVENTIKKYHIQKKCNYFFYDYLGTSLGILEEISSKTRGMKMREDNVLFILSTKLKELAIKYDIFIESATQLSGDFRNSTTPDQSLLRGAKSIGDRIDLGCILLPPTEKDMEDIRAAGYAAKWGVEPNIKMSVYKNRRGKYTNCYIWMYADKGTCRFIPLGATTWDLRPLDIAPLNITAYGRGGEKA